MSYQIGIDTLHLRPTPRLAHTEYCSNEDLIEYVRRQAMGVAGGSVSAGNVSFADAWQYDFLWATNDGPVPWSERGRVTDMGHAEFLRGGRDRRDTIHCPFKDVGEVLAFDAVAEYGLPDRGDLAAYYENWYCEKQRANPNQVFPGGYYKTIVSGAIQAFGWDMLLQAAACRDRFERVLDSFFHLSRRHFEAWAETSIEAFICHDDMVWAEGPFMHPDFYRRVIFPRYQCLWEPLRRAGKIVLFCSDGTFTEFVDDIIAAGAHGLIFEPTTDLEYVVRHYGQTHVIVSSQVDARTLTFGTTDQIRAEIDATLRLARNCPGFIFAVGNHIPSNVPVDNALFYYDYLSSHWQRF